MGKKRNRCHRAPEPIVVESLFLMCWTTIRTKFGPFHRWIHKLSQVQKDLIWEIYRIYHCCFDLEDTSGLDRELWSDVMGEIESDIKNLIFNPDSGSSIVLTDKTSGFQRKLTHQYCDNLNLLHQTANMDHVSITKPEMWCWPDHIFYFSFEGFHAKYPRKKSRIKGSATCERCGVNGYNAKICCCWMFDVEFCKQCIEMDKNGEGLNAHKWEKILV